MLKLTILLSLTVGLTAASAESTDGPEPAVAAATLLAENQALCEDLASSRSTSAVARAGRKALARETLAIADEMVRRMPRTRPETAPLEKSVRLQRRLCRGRLARGEKSALCTELESAEKHLVELVPIEPVERERVLRRFLDRRERAALEAIENARAQQANAPAAEAVSPPSSSAEASAETLAETLAEAPAGKRSSSSPPLSETASTNAVARTKTSRPQPTPRAVAEKGEQQWDPSPGEIARRRRSRQAAVAARMTNWRPLIVGQLRPVVAVRAHLHRELGHRSLAQARGVCSELGRTAEAVDYRLVLETPERDLRSDLDRMLAEYAGAGRWCRDGRFSFAWNAISKADGHWRRVGARLARAGG